MNPKLLFPILIVLLLAIPGFNAEKTPAQALLVLSKSERIVTIIDPVSLKGVASVPVGPDPHEITTSSDGRFAYVSNYGGGLYNTLAVIDLAEQKALPSVDLGGLRAPHGLWFAGGKVWFTAETSKAIGSYDPVSGKVDWILGTGQNRTHMIYVFNDLNRIVTSNITSGTMSIIEKYVPRTAAGGSGREDWNQTIVNVGNGTEGFDVSPDGREIWGANSQDGTVAIIDVATKKVIQTVAANMKGANRLKFTPDGKRVFISSLSTPEVCVLDTAARNEVKRIKLGRAAGIQMQPDNARVFVACTPENFVAVIDLKTLEVVGRIEAGKAPDGMAWMTRR